MEQLEKFQSQMKIYNMDAYIIPTGDFHNSEYVSNYFKGREYLSGFTGSAGTLLVTQENAYLWTDGRYFIQAANEIEGNNVKLMKMGEDQSLEEFLVDFMKDKQTIAIDQFWILEVEFFKTIDGFIFSIRSSGGSLENIRDIEIVLRLLLNEVI